MNDIAIIIFLFLNYPYRCLRTQIPFSSICPSKRPPATQTFVWCAQSVLFLVVFLFVLIDITNKVLEVLKYKRSVID